MRERFFLLFFFFFLLSRVLFPKRTSCFSLPSTSLTLFFVFRPLGNKKTKQKNDRDQALANFVAGLRNTSSSTSASASAKLPKPVVLMGDLNCARTPLDIYTTKGKADAAGFTKEEQESFERRLLGGGGGGGRGAGLRDVWRERHPGRREYTYWSHRGRCFPTNNGWRLDYALVHPELAGGGGKVGGDEEDDDADGDGDGDGGGGKGKNNNANRKSLIHDVFHLQHLKGPSDHCPTGVAILAEGHGEELV